MIDLTPVRWCSYSGDVTPIVGQVSGPTLTFGEYLTAVTADYDKATDTTRVGWVYGIRVVDLPEEVAAK